MNNNHAGGQFICLSNICSPIRFDGVTVEGGVDSENDDGCEGGACKI